MLRTPVACPDCGSADVKSWWKRAVWLAYDVTVKHRWLLCKCRACPAFWCKEIETQQPGWRFPRRVSLP